MVQDLQVSGRDLGQGCLSVQQHPNRLERKPQVAQGADEVQARDSLHVVQPVAGRAPSAGRNNPDVGIEADGAHRQSAST